MAFEKNPDELGALWNKTNAKGGSYLTGEISGVKVVCFPVKSDNPKAPAYRVLKSKPRTDDGPVAPPPAEDVPWA